MNKQKWSGMITKGFSTTASIRYEEEPEPEAKEDEIESETEKDDDKMTGNKSEKDDDKMTGNKSGQIKQTPLFVFVLLAGALVILLA